jgi:hypothetical protein
LFRLDLFRTLDARDEEPAGIIIIRNNVIQRRYADRTIWDRLVIDSPVYSGDLIRAAELSDATIYIDENQIGLNQNTLIRIQSEGKGPFQIELKEGNVDLVTGGSGLMLNLMGKMVQAMPGAVLKAEVDDEGLIVQINEGKAFFSDEGESRELSTGMMIAQDTEGAERIIPSAVVTYPHPNARYINNSSEPLPVNFLWNSFNIDDTETLRLEISEDPNFIRNTKIVEVFDGRANTAFSAGTWHWRLSQGNFILNTGQLTVADAAGPELLSPVMNSVFRYYSELPQIRFQWSQKSGAVHYIIEIDESPEFNNPRINRQAAGTSFIQSELGSGTWYWRVRPVFSSAYTGNSGFSSVSTFRVEQSSDPDAPVLELPEVTEPSAAIKPGRNYTVQAGDTLGRIAKQVYGDVSMWRKIVDANNIPNPDLIFPDQVLYIPD